MAFIEGGFKVPKSVLKKLNTIFSVNDLTDNGAITYKMDLFRSGANVNLETIDGIPSTDGIWDHVVNCTGYSSKTLTGITKNEAQTGKIIYTANNITFPDLISDVRYGIIYCDNSNRDVLTVLDFGQTYNFFGDITIDLSTYGFFEIQAY